MIILVFVNMKTEKKENLYTALKTGLFKAFFFLSIRTCFSFIGKRKDEVPLSFSNYPPSSLWVWGVFYYLQVTKLFSIIQMKNVVKSTKVDFIIFFPRSLPGKSSIKRIVKFAVVYLDSLQVVTNFKSGEKIKNHKKKITENILTSIIP